jgi:GT2 family glycosyltransferase
MKIAVGVPVFNAEATIGGVLKAISAQVPDNTELLVVDDGSTDKSAAIAIEHGATVISHVSNLGLAEARNAIVNSADVDVIIFFDADAVPRPGCIDALLQPFDASEVVAVGGRAAECGDSRAARWRAKTTPQSHGEADIRDNWMVMGLCCAFRREALLDVNGFDARFRQAGEDVDVSLRLRRAGGRLVYAAEAVVDHLAGGSPVDVTLQAYRHARYAAYAMIKNGETPIAYVVDSAKCLAGAAKRDLIKGRPVELAIGAMNLASRAVGISQGSLKALVENFRKK